MSVSGGFSPNPPEFFSSPPYAKQKNRYLCGENPVGFGISTVYFIVDLSTDGFYGWGAIPDNY